MVSGLGFVVEAAVGVGEVWPESCTCFGPPAMVVVPPESALSPPLGAVAVLCGAGAEVTPGTLGATTVLWLAVVGTGLGLPVVAAGTVAAEVPVHKDNTERVRVSAGSVLCPLPQLPQDPGALLHLCHLPP